MTHDPRCGSPWWATRSVGELCPREISRAAARGEYPLCGEVPTTLRPPRANAFGGMQQYEYDAILSHR